MSKGSGWGDLVLPTSSKPRGLDVKVGVGGGPVEITTVRSLVSSLMTNCPSIIGRSLLDPVCSLSSRLFRCTRFSEHLESRHVKKRLLSLS